MAIKKPVKAKPATKKTSAKKPAAKKTTTAKTSKPTTKKVVAKKPVKPKKAVNKTQATKASVADFLKSVNNEQQRKDSLEIIDIMKKVTKAEPVMWGSSIIGFGNVTITSPTSGRTVDWLQMGFSPRKANITLYLGVSAEKYSADLKKLGKHKTGGGCIYINKLEDVDKKVLEGMIKKGGFK